MLKHVTTKQAHNFHDLRQHCKQAVASCAPAATCKQTVAQQQQPPQSHLQSPLADAGSSLLLASAAKLFSAGRQSDSIKIHVNSLIKELEYITLHVSCHAKCRNVIKTLLRKYRLKNRDPNLYYLTLERWIRKDGLRHKSVMLLGDDTSPVQLQQCCSNAPYDDIKFSLQTRPGILVRIYTNELIADSKYKCFSLSSQTTVEQCIELLLSSLNLNASGNSNNNSNNNNNNNCDTNHAASDELKQQRQANSPLSTCSSISSGSSGFASEDFVLSPSDTCSSSTTSYLSECLDDPPSLNTANGDYSYDLLVENASLDYQRKLNSDEYVVEVYQSLFATNSSLLVAAAAATAGPATADSDSEFNSTHANNASSEFRIKIVKTHLSSRLLQACVDRQHSDNSNNDNDDDDVFETQQSFKERLARASSKLLPALSVDNLLAARRKLKPALTAGPALQLEQCDRLASPLPALQATKSTPQLPLPSRLAAALPQQLNSPLRKTGPILSNAQVAQQLEHQPIVAPRRRNSLLVTKQQSDNSHQATLNKCSSIKDENNNNHHQLTSNACTSLSGPKTVRKLRRYDLTQLAKDLEKLTTIDESKQETSINHLGHLCD